MQKKLLFLPFIFPILLLLLIKLLSINCSYSVNSGIPQKTFPPVGLKMIVPDSSGDNYWAWSHRGELYKITPEQPDSTGNIVHYIRGYDYFWTSKSNDGILFTGKNRNVSLIAPKGIYLLRNNDSIELVYPIDTSVLNYPRYYEVDCYGNCLYTMRRFIKEFNIWDGSTVRTYEIDSIYFNMGKGEIGFKENYIAFYTVYYVPNFDEKKIEIFRVYNCDNLIEDDTVCFEENGMNLDKIFFINDYIYMLIQTWSGNTAGFYNDSAYFSTNLSTICYKRGYCVLRKKIGTKQWRWASDGLFNASFVGFEPSFRTNEEVWLEAGNGGYIIVTLSSIKGFEYNNKFRFEGFDKDRNPIFFNEYTQKFKAEKNNN